MRAGRARRTLGSPRPDRSVAHAHPDRAGPAANVLLRVATREQASWSEPSHAPRGSCRAPHAVRSGRAVRLTGGSPGQGRSDSSARRPQEAQLSRCSMGATMRQPSHKRWCRQRWQDWWGQLEGWRSKPTPRARRGQQAPSRWQQRAAAGRHRRRTEHRDQVLLAVPGGGPTAVDASSTVRSPHAQYAPRLLPHRHRG